MPAATAWLGPLVILVVVPLVITRQLSPRIVHTRYGKIQGVVVTPAAVVASGMASKSHLPPLEVFYGIPYATPPVGGNR